MPLIETVAEMRIPHQAVTLAGEDIGARISTPQSPRTMPNITLQISSAECSAFTAGAAEQAQQEGGFGDHNNNNKTNNINNNNNNDASPNDFGSNNGSGGGGGGGVCPPLPPKSVTVAKCHTTATQYTTRRLLLSRICTLPSVNSAIFESFRIHYSTARRHQSQ